MGRYEITEEQREEIRTTGNLTLTPEQRDLAFADGLVRMAFDYGLQYYGMARFGLASHFMPVAPTILHHAVEMFLQGCLALQDSPKEIRKYYQTYFSHKLPKLWEPLKLRYPDARLAEFDDTIKALEKFREIRFPENLAQSGGMMQVGFGDIPSQTESTDRHFTLDARSVDKLVKRLFEVSDINPTSFPMILRNKHAKEFFVIYNDSPLID
jgi:hypothetical protein